MIAAVYARKSTEQSGVPDEQRSVARQIEHATAYARRKGWTFFYGCTSHWKRGAKVCANSLVARMDVLRRGSARDLAR
jgi:DNA invertase Pin-like site-specific DNA recombinase